MSTNMYHKYDICKHCNQFKIRHIGQFAIGWKFHFCGIEFKSKKQWEKALKQKNSVIEDEYGRKSTFKDLMKFIDSHQDGRTRKSDNEYYNSKYWVDDEGYEFYDGEFC